MSICTRHYTTMPMAVNVLQYLQVLLLPLLSHQLFCVLRLSCTCSQPALMPQQSASASAIAAVAAAAAALPLPG